MPEGQRNTPITDVLYRMEVDSKFVEDYIADPHGTLQAFGGLSDEAIGAFVDNDFTALQALVDEEHPDRIILIPRGWVH